MKLPVILLASALLCSGSMHAQSAKPEKKADMGADANRITGNFIVKYSIVNNTDIYQSQK